VCLPLQCAFLCFVLRVQLSQFHAVCRQYSCHPSIRAVSRVSAHLLGDEREMRRRRCGGERCIAWAGRGDQRDSLRGDGISDLVRGSQRAYGRRWRCYAGYAESFGGRQGIWLISGACFSSTFPPFLPSSPSFFPRLPRPRPPQDSNLRPCCPCARSSGKCTGATGLLSSCL